MVRVVTLALTLTRTQTLVLSFALILTLTPTLTLTLNLTLSLTLTRTQSHSYSPKVAHQEVRRLTVARAADRKRRRSGIKQSNADIGVGGRLPGRRPEHRWCGRAHLSIPTFCTHLECQT